jgi:uncharacterized membrane protein
MIVMTSVRRRIIVMLDFGSKDLLIPIIMVIFGLILKFKPPSKINGFYGYRTTRSMKSQNAWDYAQRRIGALWLYIGVILYIAIAISMLFSPASKEYLSLIHGGIGMIALLIGIPFVEKELKEKFDKNGNLKK